MEQEQTKSHADLERFHYEAILKNPLYALEGLADVMREDLMMNMPIIKEPEPPKEQVIIHRHSDMTKENSDLLQQTALLARHLEKRLNQLKTKRKPTSKYS